MAKKLFVFVIGWIISVAGNSSAIGAEKFSVPTFEEFRNMKPKNQKMVIEIFRNGVVALGKDPNHKAGTFNKNYFAPLMSILMEEAWARDGKCYVAGWSTQWQGNSCATPTSSMNRFQEVAQAADLSIKNCSRGEIQCHPFAFGFNKCVPLNANATASCLRIADKPTEILNQMKGLEANPLTLRDMFNQYGNELKGHCDSNPDGQASLCRTLNKQFAAVNALVRWEALPPFPDPKTAEKRQKDFQDSIEKSLQEELPKAGVPSIPSDVAGLSIAAPALDDPTLGLSPICEISGLGEKGETLYLHGAYENDSSSVYPEGVREIVQEKRVKFAYLFKKDASGKLERSEDFKWDGQKPFTSCMGQGGAVCDLRFISTAKNKIAYEFSVSNKNANNCNFEKIDLDPQPCGGYETFCVGKDNGLQPNPYQAVRIKRWPDTGKIEYFWCQAQSPNGPFFLSKDSPKRQSASGKPVPYNHNAEAKLSRNLGVFGGKETIEANFSKDQKLSISRYKSDKKDFKHQICEFQASEKKVKAKRHQLEPFHFVETRHSFPATGEQVGNH